MSFWDTMKRGAESGLETHGEEVTAGGVVLSGAVDEVSVQENVALGGKKVVVGMTILFGLDDGGQVEDGAEVTARGFTGKVLSRTREGAVWRVIVGPENRWDEDVPGI